MSAQSLLNAMLIFWLKLVKMMSLLDELTIQRTEKSDIRILNILRKIVRMKDQVKLSYHFSYRLIITYFIFRYIAFLANQSNFNTFILFHFIQKIYPIYFRSSRHSSFNEFLSI